MLVTRIDIWPGLRSTALVLCTFISPYGRRMLDADRELIKPLERDVGDVGGPVERDITPELEELVLSPLIAVADRRRPVVRWGVDGSESKIFINQDNSVTNP